MAIEIVVPRLGWTMEEGTFGRWLIEAGQSVNEGDMIFELESDKATQEVESFDAGILYIPASGPQPGDTVQVGDLLGYLLEAGEEPPTESDKPTPKASSASDAGETVSASTSVSASASATVVVSGRDGRRRQNGKTISPRGLRVAQELGVDWQSLDGSGSSGRIRERDVRAAASELASSGRLQPLTQRRKIIAQRMLASQQTTAPVTLTTRAIANNLVSMRDQFAANSQSDAPIPSYHDFFCKLASAALSKFPNMLTQWQNDQLIVPENIDIGMAVDTTDGLIVPVIRNVDAMGIGQLASETRRLVSAARDGSLSSDQLRGATFTITNLGMFGVDAFTPIIDFPQCAILGIGRIVREAIVDDERVVAGWQVTLSLTFDHRIVDGAPAAQFLDTLRRFVEQPVPVLTS